MEKVQIHTLITEGLQTRVTLNEDAVADYGDILREGGTLPPVVVFRDVLTDYLADGFHRLEAAKRLGHVDIDAEVRDGDRTAALRYALKANATHGLRRTNDDKRNALQMAWINRQTLFGHDPSVRELAEITAVSVFLAHTFLKKKREVLENNTPEKTSAPVPPHPTGTPRDRYGVSIPEKLLGAFENAGVKKMSKTLGRFAADIEAAQKSGDYAFSRISQSTLITLRNAAADLRLEMPWCVCRQCQGRGCRACANSGVQIKREYDLNPSELKV